MNSYCLKSRKDTENIDLRVSSTSNGGKTILSKCGVCGSEKLLKIYFLKKDKKIY